jgi:hypothetical protein
MCIRSFALIGLALALSTAGYANRLQQDNSDYGNAGPNCTTTVGFLCDLSGAPGLIGQDFGYSGNSDFDVNYQVFDFQVTSDITNFTLTLSGSLDFAPDQVFDTDVPFYGFGTFECNSGDLGTSLCGPDATGLVSTSPGTSDGTEKSVQFYVPGDGKDLTFYIVEDLGTTEDPTVTAKITPNAVPEPGSLPFLAAAGIAVAVLGRRRFATLLK